MLCHSPERKSRAEEVEIVEGGVGAVEPDRLAERIGGVTHGLEAGGQLGQLPDVDGGAGEIDESRHRRLEDPIEGRVRRQLVEAAGETVRPDREMRHLARDVESPAKQFQIFLVRPVPVGQAAAHCGEEPAREQPDEELQQIVPLRVQGCQLAIGHG